VRRCPSTSAPLLLGCLLREKELVIGSVELCPLPMHLTVGFCRKIRFLGKIQKSGVKNSMTYRLPNSRKSNFATEPSPLRGEGGQVDGMGKGEGCEMHTDLNLSICRQLEG
jgi:hypothetical protein